MPIHCTAHDTWFASSRLCPACGPEPPLATAASDDRHPEDAALDDWMHVFASEEEFEDTRQTSSSLPAHEPRVQADLAKRLAHDFASGALERRRRAEAAIQHAEHTRLLSRQREERKAAQALSRRRWRVYFSAVYFLYVLPGLVPLSVAASSESQDRMLQLWISVLTPVFNWVGCLSLLSTPLAFDLAQYVPADFDPMRGIAFSAPYYPLTNLSFWLVVGMIVAVGYPLLWRTSMASVPERRTAVRPGGAVMALGIGALVVIVAVAVGNGTTLSALTSTVSLLPELGR